MGGVSSLKKTDPDESISYYRHDETEYVDHNIVTVVDLTRLVRQCEMVTLSGSTYEEDMDCWKSLIC